MAGFPPSIDPSIMQFMKSLQAPSGPSGLTGGSGGMGMMMPFLAGLGFREFAGNIKKLTDLAGGGRTQQNIERGMTGRNPNPAAPGRPMPTAVPEAPAVQRPTGPSGAGILPNALSSLISRSGVLNPALNALPPSVAGLFSASPFSPSNAISQMALAGALP